AGRSGASGGNHSVTDMAASATHGGPNRGFTAGGAFDRVSASPANSLLNQFPADAVFTPDGHLLTANLGLTYPVEFFGPGTDGSIFEFNGNGSFSRGLSSVAFPAHNVTFGDHTVPVTHFSPSQLVLDLRDHPPPLAPA